MNAHAYSILNSQNQLHLFLGNKASTIAFSTISHLEHAMSEANTTTSIRSNSRRKNKIFATQRMLSGGYLTLQ